MTDVTARRDLCLYALAALLLGGCGAQTPELDGDRAVPDPPAPEPAGDAGDASDLAVEDEGDGVVEEDPGPRRIMDRSCAYPVPYWAEGERRGQVCPDNAARYGLTLIDFSDDWAPVIFSENPGLGEVGEQPYRETYTLLADERWEEAGHSRRSSEYLELFGIFPTFRVIRERLDDEERHACHDAVADDAIGRLTEDLLPVGRQPRSQRRTIRRARYIKQRLEREVAKRGVSGFDALVSDPSLGRLVEQYRRSSDLLQAMEATQEHLACDGSLRSRAQSGLFDGPTLYSLKRYQRRHMIVSRGDLDADTRRVLTLDSRVADWHTALRALRERVADAAGLIEDGSARHEWGTVLGETIEPSAFHYTAGQGPVPNGAPDLLSAATEAAARALGWTSPAATTRFLEALGDDSIRDAVVAVELPAPPRYHSEHMDLRAEIDRGDVYYELGNRWREVEHRPIITLFARDGADEVALIRWGTTIGGWQPENTEDGGIGMRYKNSPPGERVWRDVIASPAWLPPPSTPDDELVKRHGDAWVPKRGLFGPGFRSAYGLVMMMHSKVLDSTNPDGTPRYFDEGIRTHGSVSYRSILSGSSHGCHRLFNHQAVRLAGFLLRHRRYQRHGSITVDFGRDVEVEGETITLRITSRGYRYELTPPVPVEVLEGNVLGPRVTPSQGFRNVHYPEAVADEAEGSEGGEAGDAGASGEGAETGAAPTPERAPLSTMLPE